MADICRRKIWVIIDNNGVRLSLAPVTPQWRFRQGCFMKTVDKALGVLDQFSLEVLR